MVNSAETRVSAEFTIQIGGRLFDRAACAIGAARFNLYLIDTRIIYKKINIFYSNSLPDLRPDLEASGYYAFAYMFGFSKFQITTELWCLVVWSALDGLDYHICDSCSYRGGSPVRGFKSRELL
jgi:hypothetical protein